MSMATRWKEINIPRLKMTALFNKKALQRVGAYNVPFILWTGFVIFKVSYHNNDFMWSCPVHRLIGFCPGCGLTHAYMALIKYGRFVNPWFTVILALFILNLLRSILVPFLINNCFYATLESKSNH